MQLLSQCSKFINAVFLFAFIVILPYACTNDALVQDNEVCFEEEVLPLFIANCTASGCHNSTDRESDYVLTDYQNIIAKGISPGDFKGSEIYTVLNAIGEKAMPKSPFERLAERDIITIARWIDQGAKNTMCNTVCDTATVNYSGTIRGILKVYCDGCHAGSSPLGGVNYNTYEGVKLTVNDGSLVGSINHRGGFVAMPQGSAKLPNCKIKQIEKWVREGAPNN